MERKSKLFAVFVSNAIALIGVIAAICAMGLMTIRANAEASRHRVLSTHLLTTLSTLKDAETGQRGYLLTGKDEYLKPYNDATEAIQGELNELTREAYVGNLPSADVDKLSQRNRPQAQRTPGNYFSPSNRGTARRSDRSANRLRPEHDGHYSRLGRSNDCARKCRI